jgi:hypothetical protein
LGCHDRLQAQLSQSRSLIARKEEEQRQAVADLCARHEQDRRLLSAAVRVAAAATEAAETTAKAERAHAGRTSLALQKLRAEVREHHEEIHRTRSELDEVRTEKEVLAIKVRMVQAALRE